MIGQCPRCESDNIRYVGTCFEDDGEIGFACHCENCDYDYCENDFEEEYQNVIMPYEPDEGYECTMCGKPVASHSGGMCPSCRTIWNS